MLECTGYWLQRGISLLHKLNQSLDKALNNFMSQQMYQECSKVEFIW